MTTSGRVPETDLWTAGRWAREAAGGTISAMTTSLAASRIMLLADKPAAQRNPLAPKIRRYRLARVQLNGTRAEQDRFEHLKRTYD